MLNSTPVLNGDLMSLLASTSVTVVPNPDTTVLRLAGPLDRESTPQARDEFAAAITMEVQLPAALGEEVLLGTDALLGQVGLVIAWRVTRPRLLRGGGLSSAPPVAVLVLVKQGESLWLDSTKVTGAGAVVRVCVPYTGGDAVRVQPSGARGEIRSWTVTGRRLSTSVIYRVHLAGTPTGEEIQVDMHDLEPGLWT